MLECLVGSNRPLTVEQAAARLGYSAVHVRRLLRSGILKAEAFNRVWLIAPEDVEGLKALKGRGGRLPKAPGQQKPGQ